jgi:hypothetical protein
VPTPLYGDIMDIEIEQHTKIEELDRMHLCLNHERAEKLEAQMAILRLQSQALEQKSQAFVEALYTKYNLPKSAKIDLSTGKIAYANGTASQ